MDCRMEVIMNNILAAISNNSVMVGWILFLASAPLFNEMNLCTTTRKMNFSGQESSMRDIIPFYFIIS